MRACVHGFEKFSTPILEGARINLSQASAENTNDEADRKLTLDQGRLVTMATSTSVGTLEALNDKEESNIECFDFTIHAAPSGESTNPRVTWFFWTHA